MTTTEFLDIVNKEECLDEEDAHEILFIGFEDKNNYEFIETIEGEDNRWDRDMEDIFKIKDKYYAIPWRRGLTENQENSYWDSHPYEVVPKQKTITYYIPAFLT